MAAPEPRMIGQAERDPPAPVDLVASAEAEVLAAARLTTVAFRLKNQDGQDGGSGLINALRALTNAVGVLEQAEGPT